MLSLLACIFLIKPLKVPLPFLISVANNLNFVKPLSTFKANSFKLVLNLIKIALKPATTKFNTVPSLVKFCIIVDNVFKTPINISLLVKVVKNFCQLLVNVLIAASKPCIAFSCISACCPALFSDTSVNSNTLSQFCIIEIKRDC